MFGRPLTRWFSCTPLFRRRLRPSRRLRCRPALESLEARAVPAMINWIGGAYRDSVAACAGTQTGSPTAWGNPLNWSPAVVPGPNDTAVFPPNPVEYFFCSGGRQISAPFNRTPVVDVPVTVAGVNATVSGANPGLVSLTVNQPLALTGASEWDSGTVGVAAAASLTNQGTLRLANPAALTLTGILTNRGTVQEAGGANLVLGNGTVNNQSGAMFDIQGDHGLTWNGANPAVFTNSGTLRKSAGTGTSDLAAVQMNNTGGTIDVRTGKLIPWDGTGGVSTGGTFTAAAGAVLQISGSGAANTFAGTYTGSGGGRVLLNTANFTIGGSGATFNFAADFFEWDAGGIIATAGTLTNSNSLTLATAAAKVLQGVLVNTGAIVQKDAGPLSVGPGGVVNQPNAIYDLQADNGIVGSATFINHGILRKSAGTGTSTVTGAGFALAGGVIDVRSGTLVPWASSGGGGSGGTMTVAAGATLQVTNATTSNTFSGTYTGLGAGRVLLNAGTLNFGQATLNFAAGMFQLSGSALVVSAGATLTNAGSITWAGGPITLNTAMGMRATLLNNGTLNLTGAANMVLGGGGTVNNAGRIVQSGAGSLDVGVILINAPTATYTLAADSGITCTQAQASNFTNEGTLAKTAGTGTSTLSGNPGFTFENAGVLDVEKGTFAITLPYFTGLNGTFTVAAGATIDLTGGARVTYQGTTFTAGGAGTIALRGGTLAASSTRFNFPGAMFQWSGGVIDTSGGAMSNLGTMTLANAGPVYLVGNGQLINSGTIYQDGAGGLFLNSTIAYRTTLNNSFNATYAFRANSGVSTTSGGGTFQNDSTLTKTAGTGTSRIDAGAFVTHVTNNHIDVGSGTLAIACPSGTNTGGVFTAAQGATLDLTGGAAVTYTGNFTGSGAGTITLGGGNLTVAAPGADFNFAPGLFQWNSGTLTVPAGATLTNDGTVTANPPAGVSLVNNGALVNNGTLTLAGAGPLTSSGTGTLTNTGSLTLAGVGQKTLAGAVTNAASGSLALAGAGLKVFTGSVGNQGTMTQTDGGALDLYGVTLTNQVGALYDLQSDAGFLAAGGTFVNQGTLQKSGGTTTSALDSFFRNPGTVLALSGTLAIDADNADVSGSTLAGGTWEVFSGATLNLNRGVNLTASNAAVVLDGANPSFPNLAHLASNGGSLTVQDGGRLSLAGAFTNAGTLTIDGSSSITLTGSLSNFANGTLSGGTFVLAGTLTFPNANVTTNAANLVLDGAGPAQILDQNGNSGLANLAANAAAGSLTVQDGATFATAGDFGNAGTLRIDASSTFVVSGNLTDFDPGTGTLGGGTFVVAGTLQFTGANVVTVGANLVLDGSGPAQVLDENGNNGLASLAAVAPGGRLTLQNGAVLATAGDLADAGYLLIDATSQLTVAGNYTQAGAATLEIQLAGTGGPSGQLGVAGSASLDGTLTLTPVGGYVPATGDAFTVLTYGARGGDFANPPAGFAESFDDVNGILTVIAQ